MKWHLQVSHCGSSWFHLSLRNWHINFVCKIFSDVFTMLRTNNYIHMNIQTRPSGWSDCQLSKQSAHNQCLRIHVHDRWTQWSQLDTQMWSRGDRKIAQHICPCSLRARLFWTHHWQRLNLRNLVLDVAILAETCLMANMKKVTC